MMPESVFVDTSALYALLDRDDNRHEEAARIWADLMGSESVLVTHNYILVEAFALVQRRLGMKAVEALQQDMIPVLDVVWVDEALHQDAVVSWLRLSRRGISLVDHLSFSLMRERFLPHAFAFDEDFEAAGFTTLSGD